LHSGRRRRRRLAEREPAAAGGSRRHRPAAARRALQAHRHPDRRLHHPCARQARRSDFRDREPSPGGGQPAARRLRRRRRQRPGQAHGAEVAGDLRHDRRQGLQGGWRGRRGPRRIRREGPEIGVPRRRVEAQRRPGQRPDSHQRRPPPDRALRQARRRRRNSLRRGDGESSPRRSDGADLQAPAPLPEGLGDHRVPVKPAPLALSLGDPAGVGPEITVKAWRALRETGPAFVVIGDHDSLTAAPSVADATVRRVTNAAEGAALFGEALPVLDLPLQSTVVAGHADPAHAGAIVRWIETGVGLALSGEVEGLVTAPIAKAPLYEAGFGFPGHTEFLAELTAAERYDGARGPVMMLVAGDLRAALATIHLPLAEVAAALSIEGVVNAGLVTAQSLRRDFGIERPRLALAALNPHAGEGGALGREEIEIIAPAARALRDLGVDCGEPRPADTLFHADARRTYDAALCMYHDQALIPVKMLDFWGGVNVTLGLPIVRTSPDHGVGYDVAGRGIARADSLIAAVRLAHEVASRRRRLSA